MKKRIMFMAFALAFMPIPGMAAETINAVYVDGIAPIMIDGDLSDWALTNMPFIPITQVNQFS